LQDVLLLVVSDNLGENAAVKLEEDWDNYFWPLEQFLGTKMRDCHPSEQMIRHRGPGSRLSRLSKETRELVVKLFIGIPISRLVEIETERRFNQQQDASRARKQALTSVERAYHILEDPTRYPKLHLAKALGEAIAKSSGVEAQPVPSMLGKIRSKKCKMREVEEQIAVADRCISFYNHVGGWPGLEDVVDMAEHTIGKSISMSDAGEILGLAKRRRED
jgi:hypothetical protein